jgi:phage gpG-like protein
MQIPRRNFLELDQQMDQGIQGILQKHFDEVFKDIVPF